MFSKNVAVLLSCSEHAPSYHYNNVNLKTSSYHHIIVNIKTVHQSPFCVHMKNTCFEVQNIIVYLYWLDFSSKNPCFSFSFFCSVPTVNGSHLFVFQNPK